ncbi:MAG: hypothetical protein R3C68_02075 [Myxococcota bacterium]
MNKHKLLWLLITGAVAAAIGAYGLRTLASGPLVATHSAYELLRVQAAMLEQELRDAGADLDDAAAALAQQEGFSGDMRLLAITSKAARVAGEPTNYQRTRIETLTEALKGRVDGFREGSSDISGITIYDDEGAVLYTDSPRFKVGQIVALQELPEPSESADEEEGRRRPIRRKDKTGPLTIWGKILDGSMTSEVVVDPQGIFFWGATPVVYRSNPKSIGAVLVERRLQQLPGAVSAKAFVAIEEQIVVGSAPVGYVPANLRVAKKPVLLTAVSPKPLVGPLRLPFPGFFMEAPQPGIWGQTFAVPGIDAAVGVAFADTVPGFEGPLGAQLYWLVALVLIWLLQAVYVVRSGRRLNRGLVRVADFLGRVHQGSNARSLLDERKLPKDLHRLARLINKISEQSPASTLTALMAFPA